MPMAHLDYDMLEGVSQCSTNGTPLTTFDTEGIDEDGMASFCPKYDPFRVRPHVAFLHQGPGPRACQWTLHLQCADRDCAPDDDREALQGHGASHVSKGNLVILIPQAASEQAPLLPLSATEIANEFVVIRVSHADQPNTMNQIPKKLLTVRRDMRLAALKWLQEHNPLYRDVGIDHKALQTYPVNGPLPVPTFDNIASASTAAVGSSYFTSLPPPPMSRVLHLPIALPLHLLPPLPLLVHRSPLLMSPMVLRSLLWMYKAAWMPIANSMTHVADSRKISAFMSIKNGEKFLVYPSGSTPMREWASSDTFAALLPDLFPYGCGVFEDPLRPSPKKVSFAAHVNTFSAKYMEGRIIVNVMT
ncbi:hypothetical protein L202_05178 [Cryptococcus amylolentus CBS 6039]|uniref:DUF6570 domain-containing protein n=1 Tax=Cryptococcus amylolentus CBS 6039 TaxID=1295533 RepID=A0A1E3HM44_9TREE|nr:hypothetical protein L202_05178 [Cryptococcus amylolentus CBS 6039]ODN76511.1 hypothetical protein L202_05178 [Cryptococcus amylolentus CBS 6039]